MVASVPVVAAATAAADIAAEAVGGKVAAGAVFGATFTVGGFNKPSSSRIDRLELPEPSICC